MATLLQTPEFPNQLCVKDYPICAWQSTPCLRKAQRSQGQGHLHPLNEEIRLSYRHRLRGIFIWVWALAIIYLVVFHSFR
jgi:hypothetical protein